MITFSCFFFFHILLVFFFGQIEVCGFLFRIFPLSSSLYPNSNKWFAYLLFIEFAILKTNITATFVWQMSDWMDELNWIELNVCMWWVLCMPMCVGTMYYCMSAHAPNSMSYVPNVFCGFGCQNAGGMNLNTYVWVACVHLYVFDAFAPRSKCPRFECWEKGSGRTR